MGVNRLKNRTKPLGFSKTVVTGYLAPVAAVERRRPVKNGGLPGRPSVRAANGSRHWGQITRDNGFRKTQRFRAVF